MTEDRTGPQDDRRVRSQGQAFRISPLAKTFSYKRETLVWKTETKTDVTHIHFSCWYKSTGRHLANTFWGTATPGPAALRSVPAGSCPGSRGTRSSSWSTQRSGSARFCWGLARSDTGTLPRVLKGNSVTSAGTGRGRSTNWQGLWETSDLTRRGLWATCEVSFSSNQMWDCL